MEKLLLEEGEVVSCLGAERLRVEMWLGCCFRLVLGWLDLVLCQRNRAGDVFTRNGGSH